MEGDKTSKLERVKAALEARGWSWHGANGTASGKRECRVSRKSLVSAGSRSWPVFEMSGAEVRL
jgi:lambda repressor-like predicted transcriptional regulator